MNDSAPSDRQLLLAIRRAVTASAGALACDRESAAMLNSASTALGVLAARLEGGAEPAETLNSIQDRLEKESAEAGACMTPPIQLPHVADTDMEALRADLDAHLYGLGPSRIEEYKKLSGGFSRETIAFEAIRDSTASSLVLRRQQSQGLLDGIGLSVAQEFPLLCCVFEAGLPVPEPLWLEAEGHILAGPYSVSRRVGGASLGTSVAGCGISEVNLEAMAMLLARIHKLDWRRDAATLLAAFELDEEPQSRLVATQKYLDRWNDYRLVHSIALSPALADVDRWLHDNMPADGAPPSLFHGDIGFHNLLFEGDRITALIDWEMSFLGSPAKDLAQIYKMVSGLVPWDRFMGWYRQAGGEDVSVADIGYFEIFSGFNYLLVCEVARQAMLSQPDPDIAYVDLAFPARAHFYAELLDAMRRHSSRTEKGVVK
jgi:aminoglycoside phosphotransferase (APT) family kinase protein